jgi:cobalt-zinc-cadmium efflux system protein
MLGSVGVIIGAMIIHFTGYYIADPIIAVLIGLWVLPRTWVLVREAGNVLMEGAPAGIDTDQVRAELLAVPGVSALHDLHVWALSTTRPALAAHVVTEPDIPNPDGLRVQLVDMLDTRFGIAHVTLQMEASPCGPGCEEPQHR